MSDQKNITKAVKDSDLFQSQRPIPRIMTWLSSSKMQAPWLKHPYRESLYHGRPSVIWPFVTCNDLFAHTTCVTCSSVWRDIQDCRDRFTDFEASDKEVVSPNLLPNDKNSISKALLMERKRSQTTLLHKSRLILYFLTHFAWH